MVVLLTGPTGLYREGLLCYICSIILYVTLDQRFCICHISDVALSGMLQLPNCATTSQWNVVQLPIGI